MKNHYWYFYIGLLLTAIFGGSFLIRLIRDGDFYIAEFIGGIVGIVVLLIGVFFKKRKFDDEKLNAISYLTSVNL